MATSRTDPGPPGSVRAPMALLVLAAVAVVVPAGLLTGAMAAPVPGLRRPRRARALGAAGRAGRPRRRGRDDGGPARARRDDHPRDHAPPTAGSPPPAGPPARPSCGWSPALAGLVLSFADASGDPADRPRLRPAVPAFVLSIEVLRVAAISLGLALVVAVGASVARHRRATMVALAALSVLAVLPLALAGHAAGSASHDTAVNSLAVHLVAAVLWVGGLLGLVVLRPVLGRGLAVSVARYSTLAGWCFVLVALSGRAERLDPAGLAVRPRLAVRRAGPRQGARPRGARPRGLAAAPAAWSTGWPPTRVPVASSPASPWSRSSSWAPPSAWRRPCRAARPRCPTWWRGGPTRRRR